MPRATQTRVWIDSEGDAWHARNAARRHEQPDDRIIQVLKEHNIVPTAAFEVGCGDGWRLRALRSAFGCSTFGCDVSKLAVGDDPGLITREARNLKDVKTDDYDLVIYGFCLYACDPRDYFRIAAEGDRILQDNGHVVIYDFDPDYPHSRKYEHDERLRTTKMRFGQLWMWNPQYSLVTRKVFAHEEGEEITDDTRVAVTVLRKNSVAKAYPLRS